uniref:Uncharacterized protein n=1 Tax=mine drainage metagenome TaxID=410659 RepID=E6PKP4_9ZZZZ
MHWDDAMGTGGDNMRGGSCAHEGKRLGLDGKTTGCQKTPASTTGR